MTNTFIIQPTLFIGCVTHYVTPPIGENYISFLFVQLSSFKPTLPNLRSVTLPNFFLVSTTSLRFLVLNHLTRVSGDVTTQIRWSYLCSYIFFLSIKTELDYILHRVHGIVKARVPFFAPLWVLFVTHCFLMSRDRGIDKPVR